jgi:TatD DNase family protein
MLVDVHTHLDLPEFKKDLDNVIERAKTLGFVTLITNGTDPKSNREILKLSKKYDIVEPALGMYPSTSIELSDKEIKEELEFIEKIKPIAIGEVGLDNYRVKNLDRQKEVFKKIIKLAIKLDIPLIVHSRKAEEETINLLEEFRIKKVVMHCFSGNSNLTERGVKNGWMFSVPSIVIRSKTYRKLTKRVPLNQLLTETDAPFLSPIEGERNEPANINNAIKKMAELKEILPEELKNIIYSNFQRMFSK